MAMESFKTISVWRKSITKEHALWVNAGKSNKSASFMMKQENQGDLKWGDSARYILSKI